MITVISRTVILYALVLIAVRFMGKRQIGELQLSEFVVALMISEVASVPMQSIDIPIVHGVVPVIILTSFEILVSFLSLKSQLFRRLITGTPVVVVSNGKPIQKIMRKMSFTIADLYEELRLLEVTHLNDIRYAIVETNGKLSVVKNEATSLSVFGFEYPIVADGKVCKSSLQSLRKSQNWVYAKLSEQSLAVKDIFLMAVDENDNTIIFNKEKK